MIMRQGAIKQKMKEKKAAAVIDFGGFDYLKFIADNEAAHKVKFAFAYKSSLLPPAA